MPRGHGRDTLTLVYLDVVYVMLDSNQSPTNIQPIKSNKQSGLQPAGSSEPPRAMFATLPLLHSSHQWSFLTSLKENFLAESIVGRATSLWNNWFFWWRSNHKGHNCQTTGSNFPIIFWKHKFPLHEFNLHLHLIGCSSLLLLLAWATFGISWNVYPNDS